MTILIDARPLVDQRSGGVGRVTKGLIQALLDGRPSDNFILLTTGWHKPDLNSQFPILNSPTRQPAKPANSQIRITHHHLKIPNKLWSLLSMLGLVSLDRLVKTKADWLLLPNLGFVGRLRTPYLLVAHDLSFLIEPRWFSLKARLWHLAVGAKRLIKNAAKICAVSERTKQDIVNLLGVPQERITVLKMGLAPAPTEIDLPPQLVGRRFILALGAGDRRKNASCAIQAVEALHSDPRFSDVILVLCGANPPTRQPANPLTLFLNHPSDQALAALMKHAAAFLYPSWYEGFGLPLHEAARFGTPCLASTSSALPETAPTGTLFAPPSKPHLWTAALSLILYAPEKYRTSTSLDKFSSIA